MLGPGEWLLALLSSFLGLLIVTTALALAANLAASAQELSAERIAQQLLLERGTTWVQPTASGARVPPPP
jgi:hypothetical protein